MYSYVRFYLPSLLPAVDHILWVDSDALVLGDVHWLMSTVFVKRWANALLAAVPKVKTLKQGTTLTPKSLAHLGLHGVSINDTLFNAGMVALNLRQWREEGVTSQLERLVRALKVRVGFKGFPGMSTVADSQTPMVLLFHNLSGSHGRRRVVQPLPPAWNVDGLGWRSPTGKFKVPRRLLCGAHYLHWSGGHKPWTLKGADHYQDLWTPYGQFVISTQASPEWREGCGNGKRSFTERLSANPGDTILGRMRALFGRRSDSSCSAL